MIGGTLCGAGLGLRRPLMASLAELPADAIDFLEVAPENWIGVGGRHGRAFRTLAERWPVLLHGLSLDIAGPRPLDVALVERIRDFRRTFHCPLYSEHLSACADDAHLYDLLPVPFTADAVKYVAARVRQVQDILGERIVLENSTYYLTLDAEMDEATFIRAVAEEADCALLLDVNNVYVNSRNHGYDADDFLRALPRERVSYLHVAGHLVEADGFRVDTHGTAVVDPVWQLLEQVYAACGPLPTLLERDFNFPGMPILLDEIAAIRRRQAVAA